MEKKNFKNLFLLPIFLISLLLLGSAAFDEELASEEYYENFKILITAQEGLQFSKEESPGGRKIIYDCALGLKDSGIIRVFDDIHPDDMKSLTIKNCHNLTILISSASSYYERFNKLKELKITNVNFLKLDGPCHRCIDATFREDFKVSISNVKFLDIQNFFHVMGDSGLSLKLQNVVIDTLQDLFNNYYSSKLKVLNLHLKNVKITETKTRAIYSEGNSNFTVTVEDSHFENINSDAFVFQGEVKITNSTFRFLDERAFSINTTSSFLFSGNHVKKMLNPFNIGGFEVNLINNTFDSITTPWLPEMGPSITYFRVINITGNVINHWSQNLFYMGPRNTSDIIIFKDNYLNCTCKNAILVEYKPQNDITKVFLNKQHKNFCHNLENCPLHKALKLESGICSDSFRCPEDQNEDEDNYRLWPSRIKSILSVLKNIDFKLDQIVAKNNSSLFDKPH